MCYIFNLSGNYQRNWSDKTIKIKNLGRVFTRRMKLEPFIFSERSYYTWKHLTLLDVGRRRLNDTEFFFLQLVFRLEC